MITATAEYCIDILNYDVLTKTERVLEWDKKNVSDKQPGSLKLEPLFKPTPEMLKEWENKGLLPTFGDVLLESDHKLLTVYVPKLFDTIPEPQKNLENTIYNLVILLHSYRKAQSEQGLFQDHFDTYAKTKDKKGKDEKIESIRTNIKQLIGLLGNKTSDGALISPKAKSEIIPTLEKLYRNPDEYLLDNPKYTITKQPISDYLYSLKLPDKTNVIKEFWKKI